jgi:hypothetical protein
MSAEQSLAALKRKYQVRIKIAQREVAKELAQVIVDFIRLRTQEEGYGTKGTLDELDEKYIEQRRKSKRLSSKTTPEKSNATATGQMIDALKGSSSGSTAKVVIKDSGRRKELNGGKSGLTNNEVRQFFEDNGREFLKLSPEEKSDMVDIATKLIKERLKDLL